MADAPLESRHVVNGVELAVFEWPGEGPPLLFVHATGFHARCWDAVIRELPGRRAYAVDMRGHGRSEKTAPPYPWHLFGADLAALVRALDLRGAIGVGHSMGGHSVTIAAGADRDRFAALLLVDPVITTPEGYRRAGQGVAGDGEDAMHFVARRRNEWASADEMYERFASRPPFESWEPAVLRDYCEHGILPVPDGNGGGDGGGGYVLACPPAIEAAVYAGASGTDIHEAIAGIDVPVRVLRSRAPEPGAERAFGASPTMPELASLFSRGEDVSLPDHSHYIPMEAPGLVARHVRELTELVEAG